MSLARQQLLGGAGSNAPSPPPPGMRADPSAGSFSLPSINAALEALSTEQLETLVGDADAFKQFMIKTECETQASKTLQDIASRNRALAQENLDMQATIEEAKNHVAVVKSSEFSGARSGFAELQARQAAVTEELGSKNLLSLLCRDVEQADSKSGDLQDAFLAGTLTSDAFVEQYLVQRTAFHMLDIRRQVAEFSMT